MVKKKQQKEKLFNVPNTLTVLRFILTFVVVYLVFTDASIINIIIVFVIAALTDFFDGQIARRFNQKTEFGRKADMIADRFLWIGTTLAFVFSFGVQGILKPIHGIQFLFIMSRELISAPFAIIAFFSGNPVPQARYIAKVTTFLQGFALPALILSFFYPVWIYVSLPFSIAVAITGTISGLYYIKDSSAENN